MIDKDTQVENLICRLKGIASGALKYRKYNTSLSAISCASETLYNYNQKYVDEELERLASNVGDALKKEYGLGCYSLQSVSKTILVYDGFGLDTRGVILMYLNALGINQYDVCYVTNSSVKNKIPTINAMCEKYNFKTVYIDMSSYQECFLQLSRVFEDIKPKSAFFYTTPFDTSASAAFHIYEGLTTRYLIDLTDHAFWLGKCANDYFLGSREMSAYIEHYERNIPREKCIKLGVNLLTNESSDHTGLPFDVKKTKYIFSGGALYKTLGDDKNTYYRIISQILKKHEKINFLYAGTGDDSELKKIIESFPGRVYHIGERKDFYYLIQNCVFYLNTYPMFGGMMMKYSALAHKLPITLKHGSDSDGLLLNQEKCKIEYNSYDELINDVDKLLEDKKYLEEREKLLEGSVITEERFAKNIKNLIETNETDYSHEFKILDTKKFRQEYYERFDYKENMLLMATKRNMPMAKYFPKYFMIKILKKLFAI